MNEKALETLEYRKIISRLEAFAAFSASADLARQLYPTADLEAVQRRQTATREARFILSLDVDVSFNNATDIRPQIGIARRGGVLEPGDLLAVKNTLIVSRSVRRVWTTWQQKHPTSLPWQRVCRWA
jgi:DNA mismatch repair protein MutS2